MNVRVTPVSVVVIIVMITMSMFVIIMVVMTWRMTMRRTVRIRTRNAWRAIRIRAWNAWRTIWVRLWGWNPGHIVHCSVVSHISLSPVVIRTRIWALSPCLLFLLFMLLHRYPSCNDGQILTTHFFPILLPYPEMCENIPKNVQRIFQSQFVLWMNWVIINIRLPLQCITFPPDKFQKAGLIICFDILSEIKLMGDKDLPSIHVLPITPGSVPVVPQGDGRIPNDTLLSSRFRHAG